MKNHFELKNAQRVLLEANVLENNWVVSTQRWCRSALCGRFCIHDIIMDDVNGSHYRGKGTFSCAKRAGLHILNEREKECAEQ